jgi:hypothetical protein
MLTNDGRCTCEIKSRIAMAKAAFKKKRALFTSTLDIKLRKKLAKCYIWGIALYGADTWTLRAVDQIYLESFELWRWKMIEKISWTDHVRNEVLLRVKEQRNILYEISKRKAKWLGQERSWIGTHRDNGKEGGLSRRGGDRSTARHWEKERAGVKLNSWPEIG